ncbi:MAG: radical SAM family heme chaperone HemW [bacterium]|nr:radical SAM family heme chaperone HemW [bacterium]
MSLGIYIHLPFCLRKCKYCDFNSYPDKLDLIDSYIATILSEISSSEALAKEDQNKISSIYFGGGTPSLVSPEHIRRLISALTPKPNEIEITLEANPGTVDLEKLKQYRQAGVNRISFGFQSFDDAVLEAMGRVHRVQDNLESYRFARDAGFDNISIDLIFGYPNQTLASWQETIKKTIELKPEHISAYGLTIEPETRLYQEIQSGKVLPLDEETELEMYQYAINQLAQAGYVHYEISNFALPGKECQHNLNYWNDSDYLGFGAGAHSYLAGERYWNIDSPEEYIQRIKHGQSPVIGQERLAGKRKMAEYSMLALRTNQGVDIKQFYDKFQQEFSEVFNSELPDLFSAGLLQQNNRFIQLTNKGILFSNEVFSQLF